MFRVFLVQIVGVWNNFLQTEPPHGNHHLQLIKSFKSRSEKEWTCEIILSTRTMKDWQETKADRFRIFSPKSVALVNFQRLKAGRLLPLAVEQPTRSLNMQDPNPSVGVTQVICSPKKKLSKKKSKVFESKPQLYHPSQLAPLQRPPK